MKIANPVERANELRDVFAAEAAERDRERRFPFAEIEEIRRSGLFALFVPTEWGGLGGTYGDLFRVIAAFAEGDPNIAQMYITHTYGVALVNEADAPAEAKEPYYRRLVEDGLFISNGHSERGTKTIFDFKTRLRRQPDGTWLLSGKKFYCTGSEGGDVFYFSGIVETEVEGDGRKDLGKLAVAFVERDAEGLVIHQNWDGMGQRTTASGTCELRDIRVPAGSCFSTEGMDAPTSLLAILGQAGFAAVFVGIARAALRAAQGFVRERSRPWPHSGVDEASRDPYVLLHAGEMSKAVSTAGAMLERCAAIVDEAHAAPSAERRAAASVAASEAKACATEVALDVTQGLFQVAGTSAVLAKHNLDRFWRDARTLTLHDPVDYKYRLVGAYVLNGEPPPVTSYT